MGCRFHPDFQALSWPTVAATNHSTKARPASAWQPAHAGNNIHFEILGLSPGHKTR